MATVNRSALINKMHKVLKKHYTPTPIPERPTLEHLLYACCLENAPYEAADKAYAALSTAFFDWNEVRVSTVKELSEVMHMLPEPTVAAGHVKHVLQTVFEATYSFDIEAMKKMPLGQAQQKLQKYDGVTAFGLAYVTQAALGGHAIPLDRGLLEVFAILGLATDQEKAAHAVPGLERAIPKNKGVEFGSLAHQLAADLVHSPNSPNVHKILLEIAPDCKDRLPKRGTKLIRSPEPSAEKEKLKPVEAAKQTDAAKPGKTGAVPGLEPTAEPKSAESKSGRLKAQASEKKPPVKKEEGAKPADEKPSAHKAAPSKPTAPKAGVAKKKSTAAGLAKRKPR
jgi:endonuclease-3